MLSILDSTFQKELKNKPEGTVWRSELLFIQIFFSHDLEGLLAINQINNFFESCD